MSWCRSYGCRELVESRGDYCEECQDIVQRYSVDAERKEASE